MSKILVTGGNGFIGANLIRKLLKKNNQLHIMIRKQSNLWRINEILERCEINIADLKNLEETRKVITNVKPEIVYHCAAYGVYPTQKNIEDIFQTNVIGTVNLLKSLEENNNLERFVNLGSYFEYGARTGPIIETDPTRPIDPYSIAKMSQTELVQYYANKKKFPAVTLRVFSPYGMFEAPNRLVSDVMISLVKKKILKIFSRNARRDFIFIDDLTSALINATKKSIANGEIFNIGSGNDTSVEELVNLACKITNTDLEIEWLDKNQREYDLDGGTGFANIQKAKKIGWTPKISLKQGLMKAFDWFTNNIHLY